MASKKNKWRTRGRLQFKRETKRFSDGSPWEPRTDILFVRVKGKACIVVEPFDWRGLAPGKTLNLLAGINGAATPVQAAKWGRHYLIRPV